jgi:hypothetical protein
VVLEAASDNELVIGCAVRSVLRVPTVFLLGFALFFGFAPERFEQRRLVLFFL